MATSADTSTVAATGESFWVRDRIVPTLMWGEESDRMHTRIQVANYYSLMRPDDGVSATLLIDLIDRDGHLVASHEGRLQPFQHAHVELADLVDRFEGTIAVRLHPDVPVEHSHRYLGTLFFATWYDDAGHVQFSHESNRMMFDAVVQERTFLSPGFLIRPEIGIRFIVQNVYFGDEPVRPSAVELTLVDVDGRELATTERTLAPRQARVYDLDVFGDAPQRSRGSVAIRVRGTHLNHPFTFVTHSSGDFNIHHF